MTPDPVPASVTRVAIAVVESAGEFLVGVRGPGAPLAGFHEFPGGKLNHDESPEEGAVRECREETGLEVSPAGVIEHLVHDYPHGRVELWFILCRTAVGDRPPALGRFEWTSRDELSALKFPEANAPVIARIIRGEIETPSASAPPR